MIIIINYIYSDVHSIHLFEYITSLTVTVDLKGVIFNGQMSTYFFFIKSMTWAYLKQERKIKKNILLHALQHKFMLFLMLCTDGTDIYARHTLTSLTSRAHQTSIKAKTKTEKFDYNF